MTFGGWAVHQSLLVPFGEIILDKDRGILMIPKTRPALVLPLTEQVALRHGIRPWYWNVQQYPHRISITAREYLAWLGVVR